MEHQEEDWLQNLHPESLLLATELIGNISSLQLPFNVQNLLGNWLQLLGQIILVFNAQQQLWQNGPGHYYNPCQQPQSQAQQPQNHTTRQASPQQLQALQQEVTALSEQVAALQRKLDTWGSHKNT